jgi:uncharacterized protein YbaP (TraB family)
MYRFFAFYCSFFLGVVSSFGQGDIKEPKTNHSLLWKISGNGLSKPSYLFGTLHIICQSDYVWTDAMQKALTDTRKVALEMDMDDPTLQAQMASGLMLTNGKTLKDFYTAANYKKLNDYASQNDIPLQMLQAFKPFALMSFLYSKVVACSVPSSYEGNITDIAHQQQKEIVGLESVQDQMNAIESMSEDSTAQSVLDMVEHLDSFKVQYNQMLTLYKTQSLPELYQLILESPDYKDDLNTLLFDRNAKWIPEIETLAKAQSTFVAVGAGHLWGDKGVIALLRKKGYTVIPVMDR